MPSATWNDLLPFEADADDATSERVAAITEVARSAIRADGPLDGASPACDRLIATLPTRELQALALWSHYRVGGSSPICEKIVSRLARRALGWTQTDVVWMLHRCPSGIGRGWELSRKLRLPLAALRRFDDDALRPFQPALTTLLAIVSEGGYDQLASEYRQLAQWVRELLDRLDPPDPGVVPDHLLHDGDEYGPAARALLGGASADVIALVVHCATAGDKLRPGVRWSARARELLDATPAGPATVRALLDLFCAQRVRSTPYTVFDVEYAHHEFVHEDTATLVRGLVWAAAQIPGDETAELLVRVADAASAPFEYGEPRCQRVASSALAAIG